MRTIRVFSVLLAGWALAAAAEESGFERLPYNNPGIAVDLGVGLWAQPLPMDYDGDGDNDLVMVTADVPYNGTYFFENTAGKDVKYPVFKPARRLDKGPKNVTVSHVDGHCEVMTPEFRYPDFWQNAFKNPVAVPYKKTFHSQRTEQWTRCDYDGDGIIDLIVGADDWREYGWDNAYNDKGEWQNGPLHGFVYFVKNTGTSESPVYGEAVAIPAGGKPIDVYGSPSPIFADFDNDGDLDLLCGEFLDAFTYFENTGTRKEPVYAAGRHLAIDGEPIRMELEMLLNAGIDWDFDGDTDVVVGQEDGRVALLENNGAMKDGLPQFLPPRFFQQESDCLKVGALSTPWATDWDGDGDADLIAGDTAGFLSFAENLDGGNPPKWAPPVRLQADGAVIRIQAGNNGSIQGPCEAKWGYTVPTVADWDHDGRDDIVINNIWGKVLWYRNTGERGKPALAAAQPVEVAWEGPTPKPAWFWWTPEGKALVTQWRTRPMVIDWNGDKLNDLVMLDQEGYLALFERRKDGDRLILLPPARVFTDDKGHLLQLNSKEAGKSGRRQFTMTDWDSDGKIDILIDGVNMDFLRNVSTEKRPNAFQKMGPVDSLRLAGHTPCPTAVDWDKNGVPDLIVGAEDGFFYYLRNPRSR